MNKLSVSALAAFAVLSSSALACAAHASTSTPLAAASAAPRPAALPQAPVAAAPSSGANNAPPPRSGDASDRPVYRFDFVLTSSDGSAAPTSTTFTLNLEESQPGELVVGKNVVLGPAPPSPGGGAATGAVARHDVGLKLSARFRTVGQDVLLSVDTEMSALDPPSTVRKLVTRGNALASAGKSAVVATLQDEHKHYQLTVTPTRLR